MERHPLLLLLLSAFVASSLAINDVPAPNSSYVVVTSDVLVPGSELLIDLNLLNVVVSGPKEETEKDEKSPECVLELSVSVGDLVWHRSVWEIQPEKTPKSFSKTLKVMVPSDENVWGDKSVLKVESGSCFTFSHSVQLPTGRKELLVSLRTDKLKYHPGDLVMVEALVHTQELKPYLKPVNLSIHDSKNVPLVQWLNVTAVEGLLRYEFLVPLLAQSDEWVLVLESHDQLVNHTIEVEQPVGPYEEECFLVEVRSPRYHTLHSTDEKKSHSLDVTVAAGHHSGLPMKGKVELQLSLEKNSKSGSLPPVELETGYKEFSLKPDEIKQILGMKTEEHLAGHDVKVTFKVEKTRPSREEIGHGDGEKEEKMKEGGERKSDVVVPVTKEVHVTFVDQSHVLFFSEFTPVFFKPGLTYVGQVLLKPVEEALPHSSEEKEVTVKVKQFSSASGPKEEKLTLKLKPNSLGEFSFEVPKEVNKLELEALFEDKESGKVVTASLGEVLPFSTKNKDGHFLQVLVDEKPPKVVIGETLKFKVETTFPTKVFLYQVFCDQGLVLSGSLVAPSPALKHDLSVVLPHNVSHLLSTPRLVVEVLSPSNEVLSESFRFVVEQEKESPLELFVRPEVAGPGDVVEVVVKAEPFTNVYLLSTSHLLVFEPKEQELRKLMAHEKMLRYVNSLNSSEFSHTVENLGQSTSTFPSLAPDSQRVHNESGSLLFTDKVLFADTSKPWPTPVRKNGTLDHLEPSSLETVEEFNFNLWKLNVFVGPSGEEKLHVVLPEKARLYTLSAFGLTYGKGLVVVDQPVQFLSTSKVLTSLKYPDSVVRGEEVVLEVHLFNNQDKEAKVEVSVKETHGRHNMEEEQGMESSPSLSKEVVLKPKQFGLVKFPLKTSATAQQPFEFQVDVVSGDVRHKLNSTVELKYQGYEVVPSESLLLDNFNGKQVLEVDVSKNMTKPVEKSERAHVKIYGHPLGPAVEHVCQHLTESDVLEERTKLIFVQAVNVLNFISNNSLLDNHLILHHEEEEHPVRVSVEVPVVDKDKCVEPLRDSVMYLFNKRNPDGSYSFYPKQPGYVWLSSMMLDAAVLVHNLALWNEGQEVLLVKWLLEQQKEDGSFVEHKDSVALRDDLDEKAAHVPLTSKVVATLLEAVDNLDLPQEEVKLVETVVKKSVDYIVRVVLKGDLDKDSYSLNMAAYALALAKSDKIFEVLKRRDRLTVREDEEEHWNVDEEENVRESSLSVEATSYAILTSLAMHSFSDARPFVNFVLGAMKPNGVFVTSQDSYVALKALSQYFSLYNEYNEHERVNVDVNVTLSDKKQVSLKVLSPLFVGSLYFDHSNLTLASPLKVESSGEGVLLVQNVPEFNEAVPSSKPTSVDLKVDLKNLDPGHLLLKVCALNLEKESTGFLVGEVPLLSGYDLNLLKHNDRKSNPQVLKQDDHVYLVFNGVKPSEPTCVDLNLDKIFEVGKLEPRFVKLYPLNEPGNPVYKPYGGSKVESS